MEEKRPLLQALKEEEEETVAKLQKSMASLDQQSLLEDAATAAGGQE